MIGCCFPDRRSQTRNRIGSALAFAIALQFLTSAPSKAVEPKNAHPASAERTAAEKRSATGANLKQKGGHIRGGQDSLRDQAYWFLVGTSNVAIFARRSDWSERSGAITLWTTQVHRQLSGRVKAVAYYAEYSCSDRTFRNRQWITYDENGDQLMVGRALGEVVSVMRGTPEFDVLSTACGGLSRWGADVGAKEVPENIEQVRGLIRFADSSVFSAR